jgi:competence protein ComEA
LRRRWAFWLEKATGSSRALPHSVIEDYNATYNVTCRGKHMTNNAAEALKIPLGEIWISELWRPYEKFILFHELREISCRADGLGRDEAHEQAVKDGLPLWQDNSLWQRMVREIAKRDRETVERERGACEVVGSI